MKNFIFFGSNNFSHRVLTRLLEKNIKPVAVVTNPLKPVGRKRELTPTPVQVLAEKENLPVLNPVNLNSPDFIENLKDFKPVFGVLAAYGKIIPKSLLTFFKKGILNVHPSLLPRFRGATPIQSAILAGDSETGVTIILLDEKMDHGPIISQEKFDLSGKKYSYLELEKELADLGANLLVKTLPLWLNQKIKPRHQKHSQAVYCHKFELKDSKINWSKPALEIERQVSALNPEPGTYTYFDNQRLKILRVEPYLQDISSLSSDIIFGLIFETKNKQLAVKCGQGALLLKLVQPAGKKIMTGEEFLRGHRDVIGNHFSS